MAPLPRVRAALALPRLLALAVSFAAAGPATAASVEVDFEVAGAPCGFADTAALRTLDAVPGLGFASGAAQDGGGVLDRCGSFGVAPRSGDRMLAFNRGAGYPDGGRPTDPEVLTFDDATSRVSIWASGGAGATSFLMEAFDASGNALASAATSVEPGSWGLLEILAGEIASVRLSETGGDNSFVFDDLSFETIPEPATGLLLGLTLLAACRGRRSPDAEAR